MGTRTQQRQRMGARTPRPKESDLEQRGDDWHDDQPAPDAEQDVTTTRVLKPIYFRDEDFARRNLQFVSEYAGYRAIGVNAERAFLRTFGTDYADLYLQARIEALEHNLIYRQVFIEQFAKVKIGDMWDVKMAAWEYLQLINNPFVKDSTRLSAIKEMNVLFGITVVDDNGRTRAGKGLKEFYADTVESEPTANTTLPRHPNPGTPEAEAFLEQRKAQQ